jgi:hypothetical protein
MRIHVLADGGGRIKCIRNVVYIAIPLGNIKIGIPLEQW